MKNTRHYFHQTLLLKNIIAFANFMAVAVVEFQYVRHFAQALIGLNDTLVLTTIVACKMDIRFIDMDKLQMYYENVNPIDTIHPTRRKIELSQHAIYQRSTG